MDYTREGESKYRNGTLFNTAGNKAQVTVGCIYDSDSKTNNFAIIYEPSKRARDRIRLFEEAFTSREEAQEFLENNKAQVDNKIKQYKKRFDRPILDHINREGPDFREGRDISPSELMETFGLRAVEYGKWNSQPKVKQEYTNHAFDAFADLANTLNIPFKSVGLDNTLAIAFGARGAGKAAAHYEPDLQVINMTKLNGAGSLAHEWGHALDYYLGRGKNAASERQNASPGSLVEAELHSLMNNEIVNVQKEKTDEDKEKQLRNCKTQVGHTFDSLSRTFKNSLKKQYSPQQVDDLIRIRHNLYQEGIRNGCQETVDKAQQALIQDVYNMSRLRKVPEQVENLSYWAWKGVNTQKELQFGEQAFQKTRTDFARNAGKLDGSRSTKYYTKYVELFARSFEAYVQDTLEQKGEWSPYLVQGTNNKVYLSEFNNIPIYPDGEEREEIKKGFDGFLNKLREDLKFSSQQEDVADEAVGPGM